MSVAYTQYNLGDKTVLSQACRQLMQDLFALGFYTRDTVGVVDYNQDDNCFFDRQNLDLPPIELMGSSAEEFNQLPGILVNYCNPALDIKLATRIVNYGQLAIGMLEINATDFYKIFKSNNSALFIALLAASGSCIKANVGLGAFEMEWEPYTRHQVVNFLVDGPPEYEGKPPPAGLLRTADFAAHYDYLQKIHAHFDVFEKGLHTILLRKGAVDLFASLR